MLSSTRTTVRSLTARASSSFAQALPAESSRQGLLRAIAQQKQQSGRVVVQRRRHGSTYAAAVAYADDDGVDRPEHLGSTHWRNVTRTAEHVEYRPPRPPDVSVAGGAVFSTADDPPPLDLKEEHMEFPDSVDTSLSTLVHLIGSNPVAALHRLPVIPADTLSQLTSRQLTNLLKNLYKQSIYLGGSTPPLPSSEAEKSLVVLRKLLHDLPSSPRSDDHGLGKRFHRDLLSRYLRACVLFDCDDLLRETFTERLDAQRQAGEIIVQPDVLSTELAARRRWDLIINLLSPSRFPVASYTPFTIRRLIEAYLEAGRADEVPSTFALYADLDITPSSHAYSLLGQAHMALGDDAAARRAMEKAKERGGAGHMDNEVTSQLNAALRSSCESHGLDGLVSGLKVFDAKGIQPNEATLQIILDFTRTSTTQDPVQLANLLNGLLRHLPNLKPSLEHVDLLLSQAVRASSRHTWTASRQRNRSPVDVLEAPSEADSASVQAGLRPNDAFKKAMQSIIQSLRARGVRSASSSLATRLRFDAHAGASVPDVQSVWNDMLSRGIQPDKRHLLALMKGYAESGHMTECEDVVLLAKEVGVQVTRGMWMVIMTGYGRRDTFDLTRAEKAYHTIRRSEQGLDPAAVCAMIGIYLRAKRRHTACHLALQLLGNLIPSEDASSSSTSTSTSTSPRSSTWNMPSFQPDMLDERVIAIGTDALRVDHPICALEIISVKYPTCLPTRVRQVVKSIRSRARARIKWNVANMADHDILTQSEKMLKVDSESAGNPSLSTGVSGRRRIGPNGVKKRILRLFERKKHRGRGSGGRKVISAREERRQRHEAISNASQTLV